MLPTVKLFFVAKSVPTRAIISLLLPSNVLPLVIVKSLPSVETEFGSVVPVTVVRGVGAFLAVVESDDVSELSDGATSSDELFSNRICLWPKLPNVNDGIRLVSVELIWSLSDATTVDI